jgi:hypothetical protein
MHDRGHEIATSIRTVAPAWLWQSATPCASARCYHAVTMIHQSSLSRVGLADTEDPLLRSPCGEFRTFVNQRETLTLRGTVRDETGAAIDITGADIVLNITGPGDALPTVLTSTGLSTITILAQTGDTLGQFDAPLTADETASLAEGELFFGILIELASGQVIQLRGTIDVRATRVSSELQILETFTPVNFQAAIVAEDMDPLVIPAGDVVRLPLTGLLGEPFTRRPEFWSLSPDGVLLATGDVNGVYRAFAVLSFSDDANQSTAYTWTLGQGTDLAGTPVFTRRYNFPAQLSIMTEPIGAAPGGSFAIEEAGSEFAIFVSHNSAQSRTMTVGSLSCGLIRTGPL